LIVTNSSADVQMSMLPSSFRAVLMLMSVLSELSTCHLGGANLSILSVKTDP
jgi:hypothetical protein